MKRSTEFLIAAPLTAAFLAGATACSSEKPQRVIIPIETETPAPVPPDPRIVGMAYQILALRSAAPPASRKPVDGSGVLSWTGTTLPGQDGTVSLDVESTTKDANGLPDPASISAVNIGVNARGHGTTIVFNVFDDGRVNSYWTQDGKTLNSIDGIPGGDYAPEPPDTKEGTLILNNTIAEAQTLTGMHQGDRVPSLAMPGPHIKGN